MNARDTVLLTLPSSEALLAAAYDQAQCYVRDATLSVQAQAAYTPGLVLRTQEPLCASCHCGGVVGNTRFYIYSNSMRDLRRGPGADWGMFESLPQARFLVRDRFVTQQYTMVVLLHLPPQLDWQPYAYLQGGDDRESCARCRADFLQALTQPPVQALCNPAWVRRCAQAPGLDAQLRPLPAVRLPHLRDAQGMLLRVAPFPFRIGRYPDCELTLTDTRISRLHAVLTDTQGGFQLADCHSSNGTLCNQQLLPAGQPMVLRDGDEIVLAQAVHYTFVLC